MGPLLLLLVTTAASFADAAQGNSSVAYVRDSKELYEALTGTPEVIVLQNDVSLGPEFDKYEASPLLITR